MLYFAYASNLDPVQMGERCPDHRVVGLASFHDHRIDFPRYSQTWGGGTAGLVHAHGQQVWGMVFEVTDAHMATLDGFEHFVAQGDQHNGYDRETVTVDLVRTDDGSVPRRVRAHTFFARTAKPSAPSRRYLDAILRGALHHRLPEDYVEGLKAVAVAEDSTEAEAGA